MGVAVAVAGKVVVGVINTHAERLPLQVAVAVVVVDRDLDKDPDLVGGHTSCASCRAGSRRCATRAKPRC